MKQIINTGSAPNDKTGTPLRTAMTMINDNFTELYGRSSPYVGTLNDLLKGAIKAFIPDTVPPGTLLYIHDLKVAELGDDGYDYAVKIYAATTIDAEGTPYMEFTYDYEAPLNDIEHITLTPNTGGAWGTIVIDFSALTAGLYQAESFVDGGLVASYTPDSRMSVECYSIEKYGEVATLDGSKATYIIQLPDDQDADLELTLPESAGIKGAFNLFFIDAFATGYGVMLKAADGELINETYESITLTSENWPSRIIPDRTQSSNIIALGNFTGTLPTP